LNENACAFVAISIMLLNMGGLVLEKLREFRSGTGQIPSLVRRTPISFPDHFVAVGKGLGDFHCTGSQQLAQFVTIPARLLSQSHHRTADAQWAATALKTMTLDDARKVGRSTRYPLSNVGSLSIPTHILYVIQPATFPSGERYGIWTDWGPDPP